MTTSDAPPDRGTGWVIAQVPILAATMALPVIQLLLRSPGPWLSNIEWPARLLGAALLLPAVGIMRAAGRALGADLVMYPKPVDGAVLRQTGIYGQVRHPIYLSLMLGAVGWALLWTDLPDLALAVICSLFFAAKSRHEERFLRAYFPEYGEYARRVPALLPRLRARPKE